MPTGKVGFKTRILYRYESTNGNWFFLFRTNAKPAVPSSRVLHSAAGERRLQTPTESTSVTTPPPPRPPRDTRVISPITRRAITYARARPRNIVGVGGDSIRRSTAAVVASSHVLRLRRTIRINYNIYVHVVPARRSFVASDSYAAVDVTDASVNIVFATSSSLWLLLLLLLFSFRFIPIAGRGSMR